MSEKRSRSFWFSMIAMLVSIIALLVSIYEARILNAQNEASVWPYIDKSMSIVTDTSTVSIQLTIQNKGVGPAIINSSQISINDTVYTEYDKALDAVIRQFSVEELRNLVFTPSLNSVISPGEEQTLFVLELKAPQEGIWSFLPRLDLCYCSVFDRCWEMTTDKDTPVETGNCSN